MAKRPVPKYDFKAFGAAIKAARTGRKESRKKVSDEMFISPRYLANIENKGQHPSFAAKRGKVGRDNIHVIAAAYRFLLFLDFHFVKVGDFPLDCLYGFGLVDTVDMQIDDNARFQVQNAGYRSKSTGSVLKLGGCN